MTKKLTLTLLLSLTPSTYGALVVSIQPSTTMVSNGQNFFLSVAVSGAVDLFAYQFDIGFDPTILSANGITEGPFLATGGTTLFIPGTIDNTAGSISFTAGALLGSIVGANGNGTLATISFTALKAGASAVNIFSTQFFDSQFSGITSTSQSGSITVQTSGAPEPASAAFIALGLTAIIWKRYKCVVH